MNYLFQIRYYDRPCPQKREYDKYSPQYLTNWGNPVPANELGNNIDAVISRGIDPDDIVISVVAGG